MSKAIVIDLEKFQMAANKAGIEVVLINLLNTPYDAAQIKLGIKMGFIYAIEEVMAKAEKFLYEEKG